MKKFIIIIAALLMGVSASFAQDPIVRVSWTDDCYCVPNSALDYYKVTISIYDNANSTWVISNTTYETDDTQPIYLDITVSEMLDYCHDSHPNTPSFTVSASVWYIQMGVTPPEECCTNSNSESADCRDLEAGDIFGVDVGNLN